LQGSGAAAPQAEDAISNAVIAAPAARRLRMCSPPCLASTDTISRAMNRDLTDDQTAALAPASPRQHRRRPLPALASARPLRAILAKLEPAQSQLEPLPVLEPGDAPRARHHR
jgi:hypothetical protein